MKIFKTLVLLVMSIGLMVGANSCTLHVFKHDSSNQRTGGGKWSQKNTNNPHHPNTTNPGHTKSKGKSKGPK